MNWKKHGLLAVRTSVARADVSHGPSLSWIFGVGSESLVWLGLLSVDMESVKELYFITHNAEKKMSQDDFPISGLRRDNKSRRFS